uniref:N-alpha-acetyltransferase 50 n=1 Tax=Pavo cristatus TaxID=9049 RepID=A0A8C9FJA7_PAVCR
MKLGDVTPHNIKQLKRLNQVIFPVSYNDKFYKDVLEVGELAKLAYFNDIAVGAVCCRVDHSQNQKRLYIMTLGCLAPYRRLGIGTKMLNHVLNICEKDVAPILLWRMRDVHGIKRREIQKCFIVVSQLGYETTFFINILQKQQKGGCVVLGL